MAGPSVMLLATACFHGRVRVLGPRIACRRHRRRKPPNGGWNATAGLAHRPFATLRDTPASQRRQCVAVAGASGVGARRALARLRLRGPDAELARRDRLALRGAARSAVCCRPRYGRRPALISASCPRSFPASARRAPPLSCKPGSSRRPTRVCRRCFCRARAARVRVPEGSRLTVSLTGGHFKPYVSLPGPRIKFHTTGDAAWQASGLITASGKP